MSKEPTRRTMCATCPFRKGSPNANLVEILAESAKTTSSRICHSTGSNNAINRITGKPPALCRGARDVQLEHFFRLKVIDAPTDAAWSRQCRRMGIPG